MHKQVHMIFYLLNTQQNYSIAVFPYSNFHTVPYSLFMHSSLINQTQLYILVSVCYKYYRY